VGVRVDNLGGGKFNWRLAKWAIVLCAFAAVTVCIGLLLNNPDASPNPPPSALADDIIYPKRKKKSEVSQIAADSSPTFNRDIAPIVFEHCTSCHHSGEAVPFPLATYSDFKKRTKLISEVVQNRYMPPWLPSGDVPKFEGQRRLTNNQIDLIRTWAEHGAPEGRVEDRRVTPVFPEGWRLGKPDVVVAMPEPYMVPPEGEDIYRNFVVPVGLPKGKWIRGVEFRPGAKSVVHHGFIFVDTTGSVAKQKDSEEPGIGYSGMDPGAGVSMPSGHVLSWQPGKQPSQGVEGMAWWMPRHSDLVLQMHIRPAGKREPLRGAVGLYFVDKAPALEPSHIMLRSVNIDIPAGEENYAIESSYELPVDIDVMGILPHAHYLGKKITAWATLPGGIRKDLLRIDSWNFDWQGDYRYATPISLPKGSRVSMRFEYDNSEDNPRNPHRPPQRVKYGLNSSDEMGELHLQVLTRDTGDKRLLESDYGRFYAVPDSIAVARVLLERDPDSQERIVRLAVALLTDNELDEAIKLLNRAIEREPADAKAHYHLGHAYARHNDTSRAIEEWKETVRLDPKHFQALNNLGYWYFTQHDLPRAIEHLQRAVQANGNDVMSRVNLARVYAAEREWRKVDAELAEALQIDPTNEGLQELRRSLRANSKGD